ncbi:type 1 fimbrial protein [Vibrio fluvialis]|nr:type 1 fimbrial protein [Vibrio fluvialis]
MQSKSKDLKLGLLAIVVGVFSCGASAASTGTISFVGEVTDVTCDLSVGGASSDATVTLPAVSVANLSSIGDVAGRVEFDISLSNCANATAKSAYAFFESGANVNTSSGRLINTGSATNVDLQLLDAANAYSPINIGNTAQNTDSAANTIDAGAATLKYAVEYYATGTSTAGSVASSVTYTISYK